MRLSCAAKQVASIANRTSKGPFTIRFLLPNGLNLFTRADSSVFRYECDTFG
jgi:hypothetical protein